MISTPLQNRRHKSDSHMDLPALLHTEPSVESLLASEYERQRQWSPATSLEFPDR
jgi:hypothetical protein